MKRITSILIISFVAFSIFACKSSKASCDAYGKIENKEVIDQASK